MEQQRATNKAIPSLTAVRKVSPVSSPKASPRGGSDIMAQSIMNTSQRGGFPVASPAPMAASLARTKDKEPSKKVRAEGNGG